MININYAVINSKTITTVFYTTYQWCCVL